MVQWFNLSGKLVTWGWQKSLRPKKKGRGIFSVKDVPVGMTKFGEKINENIFGSNFIDLISHLVCGLM